MMQLHIRTFTAMNPAGDLVQLPFSGFDTVAELRLAMHRQWDLTHAVQDIADGVEIIPRVHCHTHNKQHLTLSDRALNN